MQTTTGNRQDSLVELFDALATDAGPRAPPRPTGYKSPDSSVGSCNDKENEDPTPGHRRSMTEFFVRVYKDPQRIQSAQPQSPLMSMCMEAEDTENNADGEEEKNMELTGNIWECIGVDDSTAKYLQEMVSEGISYRGYAYNDFY